MARHKKPKPIALITGASAGMGKDFALRLLKEGYVVYGGARRVEKMGDIVAAGGYALALDVTDETSAKSAIAHIITQHGRIDVLINNAGYGQFGAVEDVPLSEARRQMDVNLFGLAFMSQLVLPHMRSQKGGTIFNISSIGGKVATPMGGWYHASKFAVEALSDALRLEVRPFGIHVVVIEPGGIASEWSGIAMQGAKRYSSNGPYARLAEAMVKIQTRIAALPPPSVISDLIVKALRSRHPKTRYSAGHMAGTILTLRRLLSDRQLDTLIAGQFK